jgi:GT2 family glycosyltransferase
MTFVSHPRDHAAMPVEIAAKAGESQGTPTVSVIIPVYDDWDRLGVCLAALKGQTLACTEFEVIIADNGERPHPPPVDLPRNFRLVHEPQPGSYAARNAAVAAAKGQYFAFTDSDCIPDPCWLENGLALLRDNPGSRVTGSIEIIPVPGGGHHAYLYSRYADLQQRAYSRTGMCATANLLVSRETFQKVGPFDLGYSGGDLRWSRRAEAQGVPLIFEDGVLVRHPARKTLRDILRKRKRIAGSQARNMEVGLPRYVLARLVPPRPHVLPFPIKQVGWRSYSVLYAMSWAAALAEAQEATLICLGMKRPRRR